MTKEIGRLGILHLAELGNTPGLSDLGWTLGQELEILNRYQSAKRQLDEIFVNTEISKESQHTPWRFEANPLTDIDDIEKRIDEYHDLTTKINDEIFALRDKLAIEEDNLRRAQNLRGIHTDVAFLRSLENVHVSVGYIPRRNVVRLEEVVTVKFAVHIPLEPIKGKDRSAFCCLPAQAEELSLQLKSIGFEPIPLPDDCSGIPEEAINEIERKIDGIAVQIKEGENKLRGFGWTYRGELLRLLDHLATNLDILKSVKSMGLSEHTALITGWVPREKVTVLEKSLRETLGDTVYMSVVRPEDIPEVRS
ncbi:MAG: hypothetical protein L0213_15270, partial [Candidatus Dadabacteria bacterium]|nr:hypothetical protein [Candidatus Dadabacteria bacterium]